MILSCDGCRTVRDCLIVEDYGNQCRYCPECAGRYQDFVAAMTAEEQRRQREYDLWQEERRRHVALAVMPMDLPKRAARGKLMVLG